MRNFIFSLLLIAFVITGLPISASRAGAQEEVTVPEDLMREHGVLRRVLLVYEEIISRLDNGKEFKKQVLADAAGIIRNFIEEYHEKLEEDYIFPRFEKAGRLTDLVKVLRQQHDIGRKLTNSIMIIANTDFLKSAEERKRLAQLLHSFINMYRPHAAREDTVLFPAFHSVISPQEYDGLGDEFEAKENQLFGKNGFENTVAKVAQLEQSLGIYDLSRFTEND